MIIAVSACIVSAVVVALTQAKKERAELEFNILKDSYMGLQEDNRVLDTCLIITGDELMKKGEVVQTLKEELSEMEYSVRRMNSFNLNAKAVVSVAEERELRWKETADKKAAELAQAKEEVERLKKSMDFVVYERDLNKEIRAQNWDERNAYKRLYEAEVTKKAPQ